MNGELPSREGGTRLEELFCCFPADRSLGDLMRFYNSKMA